MSSVLTEQRDKLLADCINSLKTTIELTHEYATPQDKEVSFKTIKEVTKGYCNIEKEFILSNQAITETIAYFDDEHNDYTQDIRDIYKKKYDQQVQMSCQSDSFKSSDIWKTIDDAITKKKGNPNEKEGYEETVNEDASIICSTSFSVPTDPISKKPIEKACRNNICNHVYEFDTIMSYIKKKKSIKSRCPYVGCNNNKLREIDVVMDDELSQRIASSSFHNDETNGSILEV